MSKTAAELYQKYIEKVEPTLSKDRYFQYMFESVQAGDNTFRQQKEILHKVVDEEWLTTIEESLDAIYNVIEKPRKFVTTTEEVVPVSLAKKITADSVRHLSMNTQFIDSTEDGTVMPNKILNITLDETYDLYENRFIYHLIQRLITFIDKRTDLIFWSTGDEVENIFGMTSSIDDAYEEIEYKVELKIKNKQSMAENDSENMNLFMRIDRVRRLVLGLRKSSFCQIMSGCAVVRSPIQRTNLITKHPDYRRCYELWRFLERYDSLGYKIEREAVALSYDEEYLIRQYIDFVTHYASFKTLIDPDVRNMDTVIRKKYRVHKPKFIKEIREELVDDPDLPDVEVRHVFLREVTQAQLDAEAKLAEMAEKANQLESQIYSFQSEMESMQMQMDAALAGAQAAYDQAEAAELAKQKAEQEREEAENKAVYMESRMIKAEAEVNTATAKMKAAVDEAAECRKAERLATQEASRAVKERAEFEKMANRATEAAAKIEQLSNEKMEKATAMVEQMRVKTAKEVESIQKKAEKEIAAAIRKSDAVSKAAEERSVREITKAKDAAEAKILREVTKAKESAELRVEKAKENAAAKIAESKEWAKAQAENAKNRADLAEQRSAEAQERAKERIAKAEDRIRIATDKLSDALSREEAASARELQAQAELTRMKELEESLDKMSFTEFLGRRRNRNR